MLNNLLKKKIVFFVVILSLLLFGVMSLFVISHYCLQELDCFNNLNIGDILPGKGAYAAIGSNIDFSGSNSKFYIHLFSKKKVFTSVIDSKGLVIDKIEHVLWNEDCGEVGDYVLQRNGQIVITSKSDILSKIGLNKKMFSSLAIITDNNFRIRRIYKNADLADLKNIISSGLF